MQRIKLINLNTNKAYEYISISNKHPTFVENYVKGLTTTYHHDKTFVVDDEGNKTKVIAYNCL